MSETERLTGLLVRNEPSLRWIDKTVNTNRGTTADHGTGREEYHRALNHGTASGVPVTERLPQGFHPGLRTLAPAGAQKRRGMPRYLARGTVRCAREPACPTQIAPAGAKRNRKPSEASGSAPGSESALKTILNRICLFSAPLRLCGQSLKN